MWDFEAIRLTNRVHSNIYPDEATSCRLPVEILEAIFLLTCQSFSDYSLFLVPVRPRIRAFPLTLARVCSEWREICLGYTKLWASIDLSLVKLSKTSLKGLDMFLERSKDCPLHLRVRGLKRWTESDSVHIYALRAVSSHFHRCEKLSLLDIGRDLARGDALKDIHITFPILQTFNSTYYCISGERSHFQASLWDALAKAPQLTTVMTSGLPVPDLPYQQLTSLTVFYHHEQLSLNALSISINLEYLVLHIEVSSIEDDSIAINLPKVRTFIVQDRAPSSDGTDKLFMALSLPRLTSLQVVFLAQRDVNQWSAAFLGMLDRSPALTNLSVTIGQLEGCIAHLTQRPLLSQLLEHVPALQVLRAVVISQERETSSRGWFNTPILEDLFANSLSKTTCRLVPNLSSISILISHIHDPFGDPGIAEAVFQTAESRQPSKWVAGLPLREVHLTRLILDSESWSSRSTEAELDDKVLRRIQEKKKNGVEVRADEVFHPYHRFLVCDLTYLS